MKQFISLNMMIIFYVHVFCLYFDIFYIIKACIMCLISDTHLNKQVKPVENVNKVKPQKGNRSLGDNTDFFLVNMDSELSLFF